MGVTKIVEAYGWDRSCSHGATEGEGDGRWIPPGAVRSAEDQIMLMPGGPDGGTLSLLFLCFLQQHLGGTAAEVNGAARRDALLIPFE